MTIKNVTSFFKKIGFNGFTRTRLDSFSGRRVSFETATIIYKTYYAAVKTCIRRNFREEWIEPDDEAIDGEFRSMIKGTFSGIMNTGIIPVMVFEGRVPALKEHTHQKRKDSKSTLDRNTKEGFLRAAYPKEKHQQMAESIAKDLGFITIRADYEAEGVAAILASANVGFCSLVICEDHDAMMYNPQLIGKGFRKEGGTYYIDTYSINEIMKHARFINETSSDEEIRIGYERFLLLMKVSGNDYTDGVRGMGLSKVHALMLKHNIHTFDQLCQIDSRFMAIPYQAICSTIIDNCKF